VLAEPFPGPRYSPGQEFVPPRLAREEPGSIWLRKLR
jgi:hypothetical protein